MSLEITFKQEGFKQVEESTATFDKPEFRKFNMRFNNLDLAIIDTIAKRDGVSRSQIINSFIEDTLKNFVAACSHEEALLITEHAEVLSKNSNKSNKDFAWNVWYVNYSNDPVGHLWNAMHCLNEEFESGQVKESVKNLKDLLDKNKTKIQQS
jgi:hypothetical protein